MRSPNPIILPDSETEGDSPGESMWKGGRFGADAGSSLFWREGGNDGNALDGSIFAGHGYGRESVDSMIFLVVPEGSLQRPGPCRAPPTGMWALWPPNSHNCRDEFSGVVRGPGQGANAKVDGTGGVE